MASIFSRRHRILYFSNVFDSEFGDVVALQRVLDEPAGGFDVDHFQGAPDGPAQNVGISQIVTVVGQLDELGQRVVVEQEGELVGVGAPPGHGGADVEEHLEGQLDLFRDLPEVVALAAAAVGPSQEVLDEPDADVVAHLVQLLVDVVDVLVIFENLGHQGPVRQAEELAAHPLGIGAPDPAPVAHRGLSRRSFSPFPRKTSLRFASKQPRLLKNRLRKSEIGCFLCGVLK